MNLPIFAHLTNRALVAVSGADARPWLDNLLSNAVEDLEPGEIRAALLLTPQGKFLFDLFVIAPGGDEPQDILLLDVEADRRDDLIRRLTMYRLRAKVTITADDRQVLAAWDGAPDAGAWVADPRLPALGWRGYGLDVTTSADEADYDAHRLALGVPDPDRACGADKTYPIEADFDFLNGIDFKKGCFVGQETTSRMKRRGTVKNRMLFSSSTTSSSSMSLSSSSMMSSHRSRSLLTGGDGTVRSCAPVSLLPSGWYFVPSM